MRINWAVSASLAAYLGRSIAFTAMHWQLHAACGDCAGPHRHDHLHPHAHAHAHPAGLSEGCDPDRPCENPDHHHAPRPPLHEHTAGCGFCDAAAPASAPAAFAGLPAGGPTLGRVPSTSATLVGRCRPVYFSCGPPG
jgi:hypothetical protein